MARAESTIFDLLQLRCEEDESKECMHIDFAWSLPQMRALIEQYIREGKIKEALDE